jgi:hypothetical protein
MTGVVGREFFDLVKAIGESKSKQEEDRIIAQEVIYVAMSLAYIQNTSSFWSNEMKAANFSSLFITRDRTSKRLSPSPVNNHFIEFIMAGEISEESRTSDNEQQEEAEGTCGASCIRGNARARCFFCLYKSCRTVRINKYSAQKSRVPSSITVSLSRTRIPIHVGKPDSEGHQQVINLCDLCCSHDR